MTRPPSRTSVFHITHVNNLSSIIATSGLLSDAVMLKAGGPTAAIGMTNIKIRRLTLDVPCHPGTKVGDYVPFYFCPRSIMLYVISCQNHPDLAYKDGQGPIVHLEADLQEIAAWADVRGRPWAFSTSNAGARYASFRADLAQLDEIDWNAVAATDFRGATVKEGKQAEFLLHGNFPWILIRRIGVLSQAVKTATETALAGASHQPPVEIIPAWYY